MTLYLILAECETATGTAPPTKTRSSSLQDTIRDQLSKGVIEAVAPDEKPPQISHYLPHHAVVRRDKSTTKVRMPLLRISLLFLLTTAF